MNRIGQQVLQIAIPAALGYAVGRYHTASSNNSSGRLKYAQGENFSNSGNAQAGRINTNQQSSIRSTTSGSARTAEPDYPAKDFLPFAVPQTDYSSILRAIGGKPSDK